MSKISLPVKAISYCASTYNRIDGKNSFEFWTRGHLIRIVGDKPFSRGDMIWIDEIGFSRRDNTYFIKVRVIDDQLYESNLPVLSIAVSRLVYSVCDFEIEQEGDISLLDTFYVDTDDSYSVILITLLGGSARLNGYSPSMNTSFSFDFNLNWHN